MVLIMSSVVIEGLFREIIARELMDVVAVTAAPVNRVILVFAIN